MTAHRSLRRPRAHLPPWRFTPKKVSPFTGAGCARHRAQALTDDSHQLSASTVTQLDAAPPRINRVPTGR
jgi:hypothetical protein